MEQMLAFASSHRRAGSIYFEIRPRKRPASHAHFMLMQYDFLRFTRSLFSSQDIYGRNDLMVDRRDNTAATRAYGGRCREPGPGTTPLQRATF
jgi:hypothetical protein